jgi:HAD superfamily hydrolase (TIGR01509 family)
MPDYDVLLFDVIGVLAEDSNTITKAVLEATRMTNEELWGFWVNSPAVRDFDTGRISGQVFAEQLMSEMDHPATAEDFLELFGSWIAGLYDGTEAMLGRIPNTYKKACLSNTNEILWPPVRDKFGLGGLLDAYYLSHEMGMLKPDKEAYEYVIRDLEIAPERIAFFDDLELNVNSAKEVGMSAFQTRGLMELENELERLGVL